jgi:hypothetical protein
MKKFSVFLCTVFLVFLMAGQVSATPIGDKELPPGGNNSPITYIGEIYNNPPFTDGSGFAGSTTFRNISSPGLWDYWYFYGAAGDIPTIEVHRTTSAMDPALTLFFGTTDDSDGLSPFDSTNPDMTFLAFRDDNIGRPHGVGGSFADPGLSGFALSNTGYYTLAVYDFIGAGPIPAYEIHVDGLTPAPVPEPATMLLFGTGLAGLAGIGRRRFRK